MHSKPTRISDLTVLIVDDDEVIGELVKAVLNRAGVGTVLLAKNGEDALSILGKRVVHGLLCDIEMPGLSGIDVLTRIRRGEVPLQKGFLHPVPTQLPVIILTGHTTEAVVESAVRAGATGYVTKPVKPAAIQNSLERMLEKWRDVPMNELRFRKVRLQGFTRFVLSGHLLPRNQPAIRDLVKAIGDDDSEEIAIDLTNIPFVDEFGFGTLLILNGIATSKNKRLAVISESEEVKQNLSSVSLEDVIKIYPSHIDFARYMMAKQEAEPSKNDTTEAA